MSNRDHDIARVVDLRRARDAAVDAASRGRLAEVLGVADDDPMAQVYVVKLLDVVPGLGKVAGRRLLAELGLGQFTRVCEVERPVRDEIVTASGVRR